MQTETRKFGIRMEGCEEGIEDVLRQALQGSESLFFRYLEIGVASGETLHAVTEIVRELVRLHAPHKAWATVGIDIWEGWALNMVSIRSLLPEMCLVADGGAVAYGRPNLFLKPAAELLREWPEMVDFDVALVDGCHGKACVMADFLAVERLVVPGGFVIFHDAGVADQGGDWQPHCQEGINVRAALNELGLLQNLRADWRLVREIPGDKRRGGNSCVVVRKC